MGKITSLLKKATTQDNDTFVAKTLWKGTKKIGAGIAAVTVAGVGKLTKKDDEQKTEKTIETTEITEVPQDIEEKPVAEDVTEENTDPSADKKEKETPAFNYSLDNSQIK
ncbi:MAG: hypothetical protein WCS17_10240 [Prevotella sp.]